MGRQSVTRVETFKFWKLARDNVLDYGLCENPF